MSKINYRLATVAGGEDGIRVENKGSGTLTVTADCPHFL